MIRITLADPDPAWPKLYAREEVRMRSSLADRALRIEHVGSTSVPGLPAKPIIDVLLVVRDAADERAYVPPLEALGYLLHRSEPERHEHRLLKGPGSAVYVHVFSEGCPQAERMLLLRDRLRADPADRALYLRTKRDLANRPWNRARDYAEAKGAVIEEILGRAASAMRGQGSGV